MSEKLAPQSAKNIIPEGGARIILFADASFCPDTKAYGWCFWIQGPGMKSPLVKSGGGLRIRSSQEAETEALRQGLRAIYSMDLADVYILVQSDCLGALFRIRGELEGLRGIGAAGVRTDHVRGHQGNRNARTSINTQCDKRAGKEMRAFRKQKLALLNPSLEWVGRPIC